jgi:hypothetical protein
MTRARERHAARVGALGPLVGTGAGAVVLLAAAIWLSGGDEVDVGKALVAVWLAALPVLGMGALCGRLVATLVGVLARGRAGRSANREGAGDGA